MPMRFTNYGNSVCLAGMETVVETPPYLKDAASLIKDERDEIVTSLATNPEQGDLIVGAGGARKVRFAGRGKGKSGGYRIIHFYAAGATPVILLALFGKGERANLTKAECQDLAVLTKQLLAAYRPKVRHLLKVVR